jgi:hypothetical protein
MKNTFGGTRLNLDLSKPTEMILEEFCLELQKQAPNLSKEKAIEMAKNCMPWLSCPAKNNARMTPMACMFCPYGHMTECHFPYYCEDANCSHYRQACEDEFYGGNEID